MDSFVSTLQKLISIDVSEKTFSETSDPMIV